MPIFTLLLMLVSWAVFVFGYKDLAQLSATFAVAIAILTVAEAVKEKNNEP